MTSAAFIAGVSCLDSLDSPDLPIRVSVRVRAGVRVISCFEDVPHMKPCIRQALP